MTQPQATPPASPLRIAGYIRVSDERGRSSDPERYHTIRLQKQKIEQLAAYEGGSVVVWYIEEDAKGDDEARDAYTQLLEDVCDRDVADMVIAAYLNRFGRKMSETIRGVEQLAEHGKRIRFMVPSIDTSDPVTGKIVLAVFAALADIELRRIRETWADITSARIAELAPLSVPYGYVRRGRNGDGHHSASLVPDEQELDGQPSAADVVRLIYSLRVDDRLGWQAIADELNAPTTRRPHGIRTPTQLRQLRGELGTRKDGTPIAPATRWTHSAVFGIVANVAYVGTLDFKRYAKRTREQRAAGEPRRVIEHVVHEGAWKALVDVDVFDAAQAKETAIRNGRTAGALLKGVIRCAHCGGAMRPSRSGKTLTYSCRGKGGGCATPATIGRERVDAYVVDAVERLLAEQEHELGEDDDDARGAELERTLARCRSERRAFMRRYGAAVDQGDEDAEQEAQWHDERVATAQRELDRHEAMTSSQRTMPDVDAWRSASVDERRVVLPSLLDAVFVEQSGRGKPKPVESRAAIAWSGQAPARLLRGTGRSVPVRRIDVELIRSGGVLTD